MIRSSIYGGFFILILALTACTGMKNISVDDPLYTGHNVVFTARDKHNRKLKADVSTVLLPEPNSKLLWMRPAVARSNMLSEKGKKKKFWKGKIKSPVLRSHTNPSLVASAIQNRIYHKGYF